MYTYIFLYLMQGNKGKNDRGVPGVERHFVLSLLLEIRPSNMKTNIFQRNSTKYSLPVASQVEDATGNINISILIKEF